MKDKIIKYYGIGKEDNMSLRISFFWGVKCLTLALYPKKIKRPRFYYYSDYSEFQDRGWFFGLRL